MTTAVSAPSLEAVKELIDARLNDYCKVRTLSTTQLGERYAMLWESISSLLQIGGKRFRPYMLISAFDAYAPNDEIEAIIPAALAQEMVHVAMLIHDDIIDRDTIRYGIKNVQGRYEDHYAPFIADKTERTHMSQSAAILAGDVLISDSYRLLSKVDRPPEVITKAMTIFSNGIFEVVGGELLDTESAFLPDGIISAEVVARYKTASYSFISPLTMGALLAGASEEQTNYLHQYAEYLGVAYQLRDDLLGVFGDEAKTGKSTSTDIIEGKRTYLIEQFRQCGTEAQQKQFFSIFHNSDASENEIAQARTILLESGAKVRVDEEIDSLRNKAEQLIDLLEISEQSKTVFHKLLETCLTRNA